MYLSAYWSEVIVTKLITKPNIDLFIMQRNIFDCREVV
jgi:hypothetical protein